MMQKIVNSVYQSIPFYVFDGVLPQEDIESMWDAFEKTEHWLEEKDAGSAKNERGEVLKQNGGKSTIFSNEFIINSTFPYTTNSLIQCLNDKVFLGNEHWFWRYLKTCKTSQVLGAKYSEGDLYQDHYDLFKITVVSMFEEPNKPVSGGDFILENTYTIPFAHNRTVVFPSIANHQVTEVLKNTRYSVTIFLW